MVEVLNCSFLISHMNVIYLNLCCLCSTILIEGVLDTVCKGTCIVWEIVSVIKVCFLPEHGTVCDPVIWSVSTYHAHVFQ
jgi:hypothetical protein